MATVVQHNIGAQLALGELNKNISKVGKLLSKVSSGQKINSAQDDSASFCISEKMREQIRSLLQADQNVQNGSALLKTAESGIQQQIDIIRTIREKVIDADNDTNTDEDRKIIQKEITQFYRQIDQTAYETADYNTQKPLIGNYSFRERIVDEWDDTVPSYVGKQVTEWKTNLTSDGKAKMVKGSDSLNLINRDNKKDSDLEYLDDGRPYVENGGPFDTFTKVTSATTKTLESLDIVTGTNYYMTGGSDGLNKVIKMDLSDYSSVAELDGLAFEVTDSSGGKTQYVLSTNTSQYYAKVDIGGSKTITVGSSQSVYEDSFPSSLPITLTGGPSSDYSRESYGISSGNLIDISSCTNWDDVAAKIKAKGISSFGDVTADGSYIEFTTQNPGGLEAKQINNISIEGISAEGGKITVKPASNPITYTHLNAYKSISTTTLSIALSGGSDDTITAEGGTIKGNYASGSKSISTGTYMNIGGQMIKFVSGSGNTTKSVSISSAPFNVGSSDMKKGTSPRTLVSGQTQSVWEIGINSGTSWSDGSYTYTVNSGKLTVKARNTGTYYNGTRTIGSSSYGFYFNYTTKETVKSGTDTFQSTFAAKTSVEQKATNGDYAHYDIDLSEYVGNRSTSDLENVIRELKDINFYSYRKYTSGSYTYYGADQYFSFTDSAILNDLTSPNLTKLDLNKLRTSVKNGKDIATAIINLFTSTKLKSVDGETPRFETYTKSGKTYLRINAYNFGKATETSSGVFDKGYFNTSVRQSPYYQYSIDFKSSGYSISDLKGKGFMAYCATCPSSEQPNPQWFNFYFTDDILSPPISAEKPDIDTEEDINNIPIDISKVKDGDWAGLIKTIYNQAQPVLEKINHQMFLSGDTQNGILTLYEKYAIDYDTYADVRRASDGTLYGAIIMDGYKDTSVPVTKDYYEDVVVHHIRKTADKERRLIIQHTNKADQNLTIHIPSTDLKSIFRNYYAYNHENKQDIFDYSLVLKEDRKALLGDGTVGQGALDSALSYLLSAAVLVGAQNARLEHTQNNLTTMIENVQASESNIRDADMAKEMTEYTKMNVLSQASQAMLAQANQNGSSVLSLLQ